LRILRPTSQPTKVPSAANPTLKKNIFSAGDTLDPPEGCAVPLLLRLLLWLLPPTYTTVFDPPLLWLELLVVGEGSLWLPPADDPPDWSLEELLPPLS
jgi:hypothetical protein